MMLWELFTAFFQVGLFAVGGGYAALPLIQQQSVELHGWLTLAEFTDLLTISQLTPGPIGINAATFVGMRIAGTLGAVVATAGCVAPSCVIVSILGWFYNKYRNLATMQEILGVMRPAVVALIASAAVSIVSQALWGEAAPTLFGTDFAALALVLAGFVVLRKWKPSAIWVILASGAAGLAMELVRAV